MELLYTSDFQRIAVERGSLKPVSLFLRIEINLAAPLTHLNVERLAGAGHGELMRDHHIDHALYIFVHECAHQAAMIAPSPPGCW